MDELDDRLDAMAYALYMLMIMGTWKYKYVDGAGNYKSGEDHSSSISFQQNTIVKRYLRRREKKKIRREEERDKNRNRQGNK